VVKSPDYILCVQHGWADTERAIARLAQSLATDRTLIVNPNLGWWRTWFRISPLIKTLENQVNQLIAQYPHTPFRVVGHSMGGLIWLELLHRHPEWRSQVESLVLIGSPIGGASLARMVDPMKVGVGIANDLGKSRREIAETIAQEIPTLIIAGDIDKGSDGTVTVEATKFFGAKFVCLSGLNHVALRNHPEVTGVILEFWEDPSSIPTDELSFVETLIGRLRSIPGMTDDHPRNFVQSEKCMRFADGLKICRWRNIWQIDHVFLASQQEHCLYSGYVGWFHRQDLEAGLSAIAQDYGGKP
jgi:hypothetical protein